MAAEQGLITRTYSVGVDFSTSQYAIVGISTATPPLLIFPTTAGASVIGVIQTPTSSGVATVAIGGKTKVMTDGNYGVSALVSATTLGRTGSSTGAVDYIIGRLVAATTTQATGTIAEMEILHMLRSS